MALATFFAALFPNRPIDPLAQRVLICGLPSNHHRFNFAAPFCLEVVLFILLLLMARFIRPTLYYVDWVEDACVLFLTCPMLSSKLLMTPGKGT